MLQSSYETKKCYLSSVQSKLLSKLGVLYFSAPGENLSGRDQGYSLAGKFWRPLRYRPEDQGFCSLAELFFCGNIPDMIKTCFVPRV